MDFPHLDVLDLPSDLNGSLGNTRTALLRIYNSNRTNPEKLRLLNETLLVVTKTIKEGFLAVAESEKTIADKNQEVIDAETKPTRAASRPKRK